MAIGFMEVQLLKIKGLRNTDIFGSIDPYVVIQYNIGQECRSSVAEGQGRNPKWNEKFMLRVEYPGSDDPYKLVLKIMDKDLLSSDDFLGQVVIYVKDLLAKGVEKGAAELNPLKYKVVGADHSYCGEIEVAITFTTRVTITLNGRKAHELQINSIIIIQKYNIK